MDKAQTLSALTASGEDKIFRESNNWRRAFELYKQANPGSHKNMHCGTCFRDVLTWLRS